MSDMALRLLLPLVVVALLPGQEIRFNRDIRPILSANCYQCHGPDKNTRLADLRLDDREIAVAKGAIAPGSPAESKLVERIHATGATKMPPEFANKTLTEDQKKLLEQWIAQGADYEGHWAYIAPERPAAPAGPAAVDALLGERMKAKGLEPVEAADRRTLIRRLSFDLRGLPPTPAEVDAFLGDQSPDAYEQLVDRMLASPAYGERMAVQWLDLARYADSVGYHSDVAINVYPYRDYVVRAFNENMPFDRFTREQLAGDLLPDATDHQIVASAFNRLGRMTNEGGSQEKEYLVRYAADRVRTVSTVWLGSTLACAECHDHKFDPFAQKDFYQMAAFFADIEEEGVYGGRARWGPTARVLRDEAREEAAALDRRLTELRRRDGDLEDGAKSRKALAKHVRKNADAWKYLKPTKAWDDCGHPDFNDCDRIDFNVDGEEVKAQDLDAEKKANKAILRVDAPQPLRSATALLIEVLPFDGEGYEKFELSEVELRAAGSPVRFAALEADREGAESEMYRTVDGNTHTGWRGEPGEEGVRRAMFVFERPVAANELHIMIASEGRPGRRIPGRLRFAVSDAEFPELPVEGEPSFEEWTAGNPDWLEIRRLERRRKALLDRADECLVTERRDEPQVIRVLARGNWMDESGEIVEPQAPHFLETIPEEGRRLNRLDLAEWLTSEDNPLTARVFVNRLWATFFGTGLSKSLNDVGSQGETPLHQDVLDWLAAEFVESGWDVKHVVRTLLLTDAYRRSSEATPALLEADPYNRYHARQYSGRVEAEFVRDAALEVSGLLNPTMGGPSAKPYQPKDYYQELNFPKRRYEPDDDNNQWRRGLYTHWQRTFLHPSLMAFDAPSREECTAERTISNTPLQSLTLLNDPTYVEAARAFAVRIIEEGGKDVASRLNFAFREAFSREPTAEETAVLTELLESTGAAEELLSVGYWREPRGLDRAELTRWTMAARALLNKHEFITRY